jgi:hypothetical protein
MKASDPLFGSRLILGLTSLSLGTLSFQATRGLIERDLLFTSVRWTAVWVVGVISLVLVLALFCSTWFSWWKRIEGYFEGGLRVLSWLGAVNLLLFFILVGIYSILILGPLGRLLKDFSIRLALFWLVVLAGAVLWKARNTPTLRYRFIASWLFSGLGYMFALSSGYLNLSAPETVEEAGIITLPLFFQGRFMGRTISHHQRICTVSSFRSGILFGSIVSGRYSCGWQRVWPWCISWTGAFHEKTR